MISGPADKQNTLISAPLCLPLKWLTGALNKPWKCVLLVQLETGQNSSKGRSEQVVWTDDLRCDLWKSSNVWDCNWSLAFFSKTCKQHTISSTNKYCKTSGQDTLQTGMLWANFPTIQTQQEFQPCTALIILWPNKKVNTLYTSPKICIDECSTFNTCKANGFIHAPVLCPMLGTDIDTATYALVKVVKLKKLA